MMSLKYGLTAFGSICLLLALGSPVAGGSSQSASRKQQIDTRLVFQRNKLSKWNGTDMGAIAIMNLDGSGFRQLLAHNGIDEQAPSWSPQKDRIAFVKMGPTGLWIMDTNGHSQRRLRTPQGRGGFEPDWSPTGRSILFRASTNQGGLWTVDVRTGRLRQLTSGLFGETSPQWSPDGTRIAFSRNGKIWTMRMRDHRLRKLTVGEGYGPVWSPDGRRIAFSRGGLLWMMNADGSHLHRVDGPVDGFTWSADGKWIVFNAGNGGGDLLAMHPNGSGRHVIRRESGGPNGWHANYPDG